jgi:hypothetical protein
MERPLLFERVGGLDGVLAVDARHNNGIGELEQAELIETPRRHKARRPAEVTPSFSTLTPHGRSTRRSPRNIHRPHALHRRS